MNDEIFVSKIRGFITNLQRRICKSSVPKMTTLIDTHFILSKMTLRERLIFDALSGNDAVVLRLDFFFHLPSWSTLVLLRKKNCFSVDIILFISFEKLEYNRLY